MQVSILVFLLGKNGNDANSPTFNKFKYEIVDILISRNIITLIGKGDVTDGLEM